MSCFSGSPFLDPPLGDGDWAQNWRVPSEGLESQSHGSSGPQPCNAIVGSDSSWPQGSRLHAPIFQMGNFESSPVDPTKLDAKCQDGREAMLLLGLGLRFRFRFSHRSLRLTVGVQKFMVWIVFQTLGLWSIACINFRGQALDLLRLTTWFYMLGCGIRYPLSSIPRIPSTPTGLCYMCGVQLQRTPNLPTQIIPTKIRWLAISGRFPVDMRVLPLKIQIPLGSNPLKSRIFVRRSAVSDAQYFLWRMFPGKHRKYV